MKQINQFINEYIVKKKLDKFIDSEDHYKYFPTSKKELIRNIDELLSEGETNLNCIDTSKITDMSSLFNTIMHKTANIDVSKWNVANVNSMQYMFQDMKNFDCDLSNWNVSKVENMYSMFNKCFSFTGKGLKNWNVSNVKTMEFMFVGCEKFDGDLSGWDVSNVKYMNSMFYACINFTGKGLENWNMHKVEDIGSMLGACVSFDCDLSNWDISNATSMAGLFYGCKKFKGKGLENWKLNKYANIDYIFNGCDKMKNKPSWYKK